MALGGFLRQSTAVDILIGPFLDEDDGKTAETGLTLSQADVKLSKNGQALAQKNDVTAATHDSDGYYNCELDATDTDTVGQLTVIVHESGALPVRHEYQVVAENVHEWHVAKTGNDGNSGHSFEDALLTVSQAITNAAHGDTIILWPGTYSEGINFGDKELNLKGKHHTKCLISATDGPAISADSGDSIENLAVYAVGASSYGISLYSDSFVKIRHCKIFGRTDGIVTVGVCTDVLIERCTCSSGYDGVNLSGLLRGVVKSSTFYSDGSYGTAPARGGYLGGNAVYDNCLFEGEKTISSSVGAYGVSNWTNAAMNLCFHNTTFRASQSHADSIGNAIGFHAGGSVSIQLTFANCTFEAVVTNGDGDAYAFNLNSAGAKVVCENCVFKSSSENGTAYDIKVDAGSFVASNCLYATSSGTITQMNTGWAAAAETECENALTALDIEKIPPRSVQ